MKLVHLDTDVVSTPITDALTSTATNSALSAKQGKVLNDNKAERTELDALNEAKAEADIISDAWSSAVTYSNTDGSKPMYAIDDDMNLYRCEVASSTNMKPSTHSSGTGAHWKKVAVADEIGALKLSLANSFTYRNITISENTYPSNTTGSIVVPAVSGYTAISAAITGGSRDEYAVHFLCSLTTGYVRVVNKYTNTLTVSINLRIIYIKNELINT